MKKIFRILFISIFIMSCICLPVSSYAEEAEDKDEKPVIDLLYDTDNIEVSEDLKMLIIHNYVSDEEITKLAKMVYGEDRNSNLMRRSAVIWCALNRCDAWDKSVSEVVTHGQFHGYYPSQKCPEWARELVKDVCYRWALEKLGYENVGRTLPESYLYFAGSTGVNRFREYYKSRSYWGWILEDPYKGCYSFDSLDMLNQCEGIHNYEY